MKVWQKQYIVEMAVRAVGVVHFHPKPDCVQGFEE